MTRLRIIGASFVLLVAIPILAQISQEPVDLDGIYKIKDEGLNRSQVMETLSYLTDVYGPRLTGSTQMRKAQEWAQKKLKEWGLENVHAEKYDFGRGWNLKRFSAHMVSPGYSPLIAYPKAWTPGTNGVVKAEATRVTINEEADLGKYRGKLKGLFVLTQTPREVEAHFTPDGKRYSDEDLRNISMMPDPGQALRSGQQFRGPGRPGGPGSPNRQLQRKITDFYVAEGVAAVIDAGRGDGGTLFVSSGGDRKRDAPPVPPQV